MFEIYTDRARRVVVLAQEEARLMRHTSIDTCHLLLGLLREDDGIASRVLVDGGMTLRSCRAMVLKFLGMGTEEIKGHVPFTIRSRRVFDRTHEASKSLGHHWVGTEHLLLGCIKEGIRDESGQQSSAYRALVRRNLRSKDNPDRVESIVDDVMDAMIAKGWLTGPNAVLSNGDTKYIVRKEVIDLLDRCTELADGDEIKLSHLRQLLPP